MAQIVINEISQNYTYNIGTNSFATVAMPITAMWGPAYTDPGSIEDEEVENGGSKYDIMLERTSWLHFPATQNGLESFVSTFRGPSSNYRLAKDYSYQMAMTLLTAGYDVLVCRVCPGTFASCTFSEYKPNPGGGTVSVGKLTINAKYPGSFGNNLKVVLTKAGTVAKPYWNLITYVVDASGIQTAVENLVFVFDPDNSTDTLVCIDDLESNFLTFETNIVSDTVKFTSNDAIVSAQMLTKGADASKESTVDAAWKAAKDYATTRYTGTNSGTTNIGVGYTESECKYLSAFSTVPTDLTFANTQMYKEWVYNAAYVVYNLLQDKLNYNPQRIISPGWDDQDICSLNPDSGISSVTITKISPLHKKLMETSYYSRCGTGLLDIPRSEKRSAVYNTSITAGETGYAQMLARIADELVTGINSDLNATLYTTHCALFAPWGSYKYVGTGKQCIASPSFLALMIQRAQILNQPLQYEWALPTNRRHNLRIGKMDYKVPKKILDVWQKLEGVGVNVITEIPDLGLNLWGNSTLYEVPPATYQALANLSTRYLVNAVENVAYKCGLAITFQYNNEQAYNTFYAGVTPILDTMKNVGAIDDYYVKMAADVNGLDQVNANTVVGKIYLVINGVINDIIIDLIALPPGTDLNQYKGE